jgi:hypothetical protein
MRRLGLPLVIWGLVSVVGLAAVVVLLVFGLHDEVVLDLHHSAAMGQVTQVSEGRRGPGSMQVEFSAGGKPAKAWVGLSWFGSTPKQGDQVRIEYLNANPGTARRAGAHDIVTLGFGLGGSALLATAAAGFGRRRKRGRSR